MNITFLLRLIFLLLPFLSCRTLSYFDSPNNLRNIQGTLYLKNGKTISGKLIIETENMFGNPVKLYAEGDNKPMQFGLDEVKGYAARNEQFALKEIRESLSIGRRLYFMKQLTADQSRLHLFEFMRRETVNKTSSRHDAEYYVALPGEEEENLVHSANGSKFVPHFEEKVSRLVSDCPALAQKIAEKRPGYFYAQVSLVKEKRAEVLLKIIDEYNQCEKR